MGLFLFLVPSHAHKIIDCRFSKKVKSQLPYALTYPQEGKKKLLKMSLLSSFNYDDPEERKGSCLRSTEILLGKFL